MEKIIGGFLVAFAVSFIATPAVKRIAIRLGAIDIPSERKVHCSPIPRMGGLAIYIAFIAAFLFFGEINASAVGLLTAVTMIVVLGMIDDVVELSAKIKLAGQIAAALVFALSSPLNTVAWVSNPFGTGMLYMGKLAVPLTVFWVVGITNTINLIDGLDGLAAGVSFIASITLAIFSYQMQQPSMVLLAVIIAGSSFGFLQHNFNPAKIFMGDTGSMFLGFVLAAISVQGAIKSAATIALAIPILALGFPIMDTSLAILRRFLQGNPIFQADKSHLHHRLLELGYSQRQAVLFLYSVSIFFGMSAIALTKHSLYTIALLFLTGCLILFVGTKKLKPVAAKNNREDLTN